MADIIRQIKINGVTYDIQDAATLAALNSEITRSTEKDNEHTTAIETNAAAITTEKERAEAKEAELVAEDAELEAAIGTEKARAEGKEAELNTAIETEKTRAEGKEAELVAKDTELETAIGTEKTRAEGKEAELLTKIEANTASITAEAETRATADTALQEEIDNLKARGRFLSLWDCTTGKPETDPPSATEENPYVYVTGDYFIVSTVAESGGKNYKPSGTSYAPGQTSTTEETSTEIAVDDVYYFDGTEWRLQLNTRKTVQFANIAGDPRDNTELKADLEAIEASITAEANARTLADNNLQDSINQLTADLTEEIQNRQDGDASLQQDLNTEAAARAAEDTKIENVEVVSDVELSVTGTDNDILSITVTKKKISELFPTE